MVSLYLAQFKIQKYISGFCEIFYYPENNSKLKILKHTFLGHVKILLL